MNCGIKLPHIRGKIKADSPESLQVQSVPDGKHGDLAGTVLNVRKNILCFYLWAVGNIAWLAFEIASGLFSRAVFDTVHLAFAIWGIFAWRDQKK